MDSWDPLTTHLVRAGRILGYQAGPSWVLVVFSSWFWVCPLRATPRVSPRTYPMGASPQSPSRRGRSALKANRVQHWLKVSAGQGWGLCTHTWTTPRESWFPEVPGAPVLSSLLDSGSTGLWVLSSHLPYRQPGIW